MELKTGSCSLQGVYRQFNEDTVQVERSPLMAACLVADGGGSWDEDGVGIKVGQNVVQSIAQTLRGHQYQSLDSSAIQDFIRKTIARTNDDIIAQMARRLMDNSGATLVLAFWPGKETMYLAGVGDCRAYRFRELNLEQLTTDETLAQALVEAGAIPPEEAKDHRFSRMLWKYLGSKDVGDGPEVKSLALQPGDRFLLCSDGLWTSVEDDRLLDCLRVNAVPQRCAEALCQLALERGSRDNVSCIVIAVE